MFLEYSELLNMSWQSEVTGEELGFKADSVNHYTYGNLNLYIDNSTLQILEAWFEQDNL